MSKLIVLLRVTRERPNLIQLSQLVVGSLDSARSASIDCLFDDVIIRLWLQREPHPEAPWRPVFYLDCSSAALGYAELFGFL